MPNCASCRQSITDTYVQWGRQVYHPQHFTCAACAKAIGTGSFVPYQGRPYHQACYVESFAERCKHCGQPIAGKFFKHKGRAYHDHCYRDYIAERCEICQKPIMDRFIPEKGKAYHEACYQKTLAEKCAVCTTGLTGQYFIDPWGNKYHAAHQKQMPHCEYCSRIMSSRTSDGGYTYGDGRHICGICYSSRVPSDREARPLIARVRERMRVWGLDVPEEAAPVKLVDRTALHNLLRRSGHPAGPKVNGFTSVLIEKQGNQVIKREMAVYILFGMPRELFEGTVAHELTHVWVNLHNGRKLDPAFEEGSCNYMKYLIHQGSESALAPHAIKSMEQDPDPAYGQGFRRASKYVERNGLPALLANLAKSTGFPFGY